MAGYTYNTFTTALSAYAVIPLTDADFVAMMPTFIDDAEQNIYRDLDLLNTVVKDSTSALVAGNRNFTYPTGQGTFVVTEEINIITPAGTSNPDSGTRVGLLPATKEMLDMLYPSVTASGVPQYFGMVTQGTIIVGPWPDAAYQVEVVGTMRPAPLSATNQTTFLSVNLPDLLLHAALVQVAGYMKSYGAAVDDPKMAVTWAERYKQGLESANTEENRKKFAAQGWSSKQPAPLATPPRT